MQNSHSLARAVVMVSPDSFGFDAEMAKSNHFMHRVSGGAESVRHRALAEFNAMEKGLERAGVKVIVLPSRRDVVTPDAVFPNNWFTTHHNGRIYLFPMRGKHRRLERQPELLKRKLFDAGFSAERLVDFSPQEEQGVFLESTGSMVLDRKNHIAYAVPSPRTSVKLLKEFCAEAGYEPHAFSCNDHTGAPGYHTNVFMSVGEGYAAVATQNIPNEKERTALVSRLEKTGHEVVELSAEQALSYCGNMLMLKGDEPLIVMSKTAENALTGEQKSTLSSHGRIISFGLETIERVGGGSARCMLAEVFLPKR